MWTNWGLEILLYNRKGNNFDNESRTKVTVMKKRNPMYPICIADSSETDILQSAYKLNSALIIRI